MQHGYLMTRELFRNSKGPMNTGKNIRFKSKKLLLDPKAKELLTKYRKGTIWKDI